MEGILARQAEDPGAPTLGRRRRRIPPRRRAEVRAFVAVHTCSRFKARHLQAFLCRARCSDAIWALSGSPLAEAPRQGTIAAGLVRVSCACRHASSGFASTRPTRFTA